MTNKNGVNIAIVGATGNVGREIISILGEPEHQKKLPIKNLYCLASKNSEGTHISMTLDKQVEVKCLDNFDFEKNEVDIAFFCAGSGISSKYIPMATASGAIVIDKSSLFRMDKDVPLVVPEVNSNSLDKISKNIIASPNCTTIPLVLALKPLHEKYKLKRVVVTTFQAVSGTGKKAMDELFNQTKGYFEAGIQQTTQDHLHGDVYPKQIAFNCIPQCDSFCEDGYTKEEYKIINETRKIMSLPKLDITATSVRVPVFRCHAESVNIEFEKKIDDIEEIIELLNDAPSVSVLQRNNDGGYAVQCEMVGTDGVYISRIRRDNSVKNGINMWLVCDNLRKGAALNGVQIAETLWNK